MNSLSKLRREKRVSQRNMASLAGVSFRTIQLIESGKHDAKLSTWQKIAASLGYPKEIVAHSLADIFAQPPDSIAMASERIVEDGEDSWKIWLFNFVDVFRRRKDPAYVTAPPAQDLSKRLQALIASTVETLCDEQDIAIPGWCKYAPILDKPWFVSKMESLKASAIMESPLRFRMRNIFVLGNFLSRR